MARLDMAVEHGQTPELAQRNFERAVTAAQTRFAGWIHRLEWSPDGTAVTVAGSGFDVVVSYDDQNVYARGTIPLAYKFFEGPIKSYILRSLDHGPESG
jgi:hypothetical protein